MTTYNTGNPLGSPDPRDLYDNAENLDEAVNSEAETWEDRFGQDRLTWGGMELQFEQAQQDRDQTFQDSETQRETEFQASQQDKENRFQQFLADSGYVDLGDYDADGPLTITARNEIFSKDGEYYRIKPGVVLPYTTTGTWATDQADFVAIGDAALRQELGSAAGADHVNTSENKSVQERLDKTYANTVQFNPHIVAREPGYHCAFGSVERIKYLGGIGAMNINLVAYRRGINHQYSGIIRGVYVTDDGTPAGEPFTLASQDMYPNIGRGGLASPNDFRDPNVKLLPDGRVLLTFFAINYDENDARTAYDSYYMIGTYDESVRVFEWSAPKLILSTPGNLVYGKPIVVDDMVYVATYTGKWAGDDGPLFDYLVIGAPLSNLDDWNVIGTPIISVDGFSYSEPVLRERPGGGYFVQIRYESGSDRQVRRMDSDLITGPWSSPVTIYDGSSHSKGLEFMGDGQYFTGIRLLGERPGIAILATEEAASQPVNLRLSGVVISSYTVSPEGGYVEFTRIGEQEWLGVCHTEAGRTIQCWRFTTSMIRNRRVGEDRVFPGNVPIGAEALSMSIHAGYGAARPFNLLENPFLSVPYGYATSPGWSGLPVAISDGMEVGGPGEGYAKITSSGSPLRQVLPSLLSRLYQREPVAAAARVYCLEGKRVRLRVYYGGDSYSSYHTGKGWETIFIYQISAEKQRFPSFGNADDAIQISFVVEGGTSLTYFVDWVSLGFGAVVPQPMNESALRTARLVRLTLTGEVNTFSLADLGLPSGGTHIYTVSLLQSNNFIQGYHVTTTNTEFTVTLGQGTAWGSSLNCIFEITGL